MRLTGFLAVLSFTPGLRPLSLLLSLLFGEGEDFLSIGPYLSYSLFLAPEDEEDLVCCWEGVQLGCFTGEARIAGGAVLGVSHVF